MSMTKVSWDEYRHPTGRVKSVGIIVSHSYGRNMELIPGSTKPILLVERDDGSRVLIGKNKLTFIE